MSVFAGVPAISAADRGLRMRGRGGETFLKQRGSQPARPVGKRHRQAGGIGEDGKTPESSWDSAPDIRHTLPRTGRTTLGPAGWAWSSIVAWSNARVHRAEP